MIRWVGGVSTNIYISIRYLSICYYSIQIDVSKLLKLCVEISSMMCVDIHLIWMVPVPPRPAFTLRFSFRYLELGTTPWQIEQVMLGKETLSRFALNFS